MKLEELFGSKRHLQKTITKAIEMAKEHPDVINWDQEPQDYDSYEEALTDATYVILDITDLDVRHERTPDVIDLINKMIRREARTKRKRV